MAFTLENTAEVQAAKTTDQESTEVSTENLQVGSKDTVKGDYKKGITNFRLLAKKYDISIKEVARRASTKNLKTIK